MKKRQTIKGLQEVLKLRLEYLQGVIKELAPSRDNPSITQMYDQMVGEYQALESTLHWTQGDRLALKVWK